MTYDCPVCGFGMEEPPRDYNICSCCGTEFDYHDANTPIEDLRKSWIDGGMKWWSSYNNPPHGWDAAEQLRIHEVKP